MAEQLRRTLMCRNHEVVAFTYDPVRRVVAGRARVIDAAFLPLGCLGQDGRFTSKRLAQWLSNRAIPATRPGMASVLQRLDLTSPEELMAAGLGLSLSDQYWLRPNNDENVPLAAATWDELNYFENPFSPALGEALAPHDPESGAQALASIDGDILVASSPDSSLNGNLPKRWEMIDGQPHLLKTGKPENLFQEPLNERIATLLCQRLLEPSDYVPYELVENGYPRFVSTCPCMVDARTEFVPAADVLLSRKMPNDASRHEAFVGACGAHGIGNAREAVEKMLVIDHVIANFDRHWGNFGILMDSESRTWLRVAPLFDMGEALWCDRPFANDFTAYRMAHPMPFLRALAEQLERFAGSLSWLDATALDGFADEAVEVLARSRMIAEIPDRLDGIHAAIERTCAEVCQVRHRRL